jgi:hypothetical protein
MIISLVNWLYYFFGCTDILLTLSALPVTAFAFATMDLTSSSDRTGHFEVTVPPWLMIFTLCAYVREFYQP